MRWQRNSAMMLCATWQYLPNINKNFSFHLTSMNGHVFSFSSRQGVGQESAEKQPPSALDFVGQFALAMDAHEKQTGKKQPMFQATQHVISEYNKGITVRKWRVDGIKKKMVMNILKSPTDILTILGAHYDRHKHGCSGWAVHLLSQHQSFAGCEFLTQSCFKSDVTSLLGSQAWTWFIAWSVIVTYIRSSDLKILTSYFDKWKIAN